MLSWCTGEVAGEGDRVTGGGGEGDRCSVREGGGAHTDTSLARGGQLQGAFLPSFYELLLWKENK